jgi:hypothetical protein
MRTTVLSLALALSLTACKDKAKTEAAPEAKPTTAETKPAETKPTDTKPAEAKPAETTPTEAAKPAAATPVKDEADYEARTVALFKGLQDAFVSGGTDCDKIGTAVKTIVDANKDNLAAIKAFEKANPAIEKAVEKRHEADIKEFQTKLEPAMKACADHKGIADAMGGLDD